MITSMKKRILVILSILAILWGFCYYYEVRVTSLIHRSMTFRAAETTEDAARLMGSRIQQDDSQEGIKVAKSKLQGARIFGTPGRLHLVDSRGEEVSPQEDTIPFSFKSFLPVLKSKHGDITDENVFKNPSYQGIYNMDGTSYSLTYAPLGVKNWYVLSVVPLDVAFQYSQQAIKETLKLVAAMIAVLGILAAYIIYENHDKRKQLYKMAYEDDVTGLGNKNKYFSIMQEMAKDKESKQIWCLLAINIHNFRWINDTFGLLVGNEVLGKIGRLLQSNFCTQGEIPIRLGSDKFLLLKPVDTWQEPTEYAEKIVEEIAGLGVQGNCLNMKSSIGGVLFRAAAIMDGHTVLDSAMHTEERASKDTENPIVFCTEDVIAKYKENNALLEDLKKDLDQGKLEVFYQAKYDPADNRIMGAEALVRWKHKEKGYIPPGVFIPLAEQRGFIWQITQIVFTQVCADIQEWRKQGLKPVPVSVNISTHDLFQSDLTYFLLDKINRYDIQPGDIELEITETAIMFDLHTALKLLRELKSLGFKLDIDDFGTGYSALSYLQEGVFDVIKIDRSFLLQRDKFKVEGEKLIASIVSMGKDLGLKIICEGAETQEQVDFLRGIRVDGIQGYFYAKPEEKKVYVQRLM